MYRTKVIEARLFNSVPAELIVCIPSCLFILDVFHFLNSCICTPFLRPRYMWCLGEQFSIPETSGKRPGTLWYGGAMEAKSADRSRRFTGPWQRCFPALPNFESGKPFEILTFSRIYGFEIPAIVDLLEAQLSSKHWLVLHSAVNQNLRELGNRAVRPRQARGTWG